MRSKGDFIVCFGTAFLFQPSSVIATSNVLRSIFRRPPCYVIVLCSHCFLIGIPLISLLLPFLQLLSPLRGVKRPSSSTSSIGHCRSIRPYNSFLCQRYSSRSSRRWIRAPVHLQSYPFVTDFFLPRKDS